MTQFSFQIRSFFLSIVYASQMAHYTDDSSGGRFSKILLRILRAISVPCYVYHASLERVVYNAIGGIGVAYNG